MKKLLKKVLDSSYRILSECYEDRLRTSIDHCPRLGRSVRELLAMVDDLREKGISLIALQDNIDATTPAGKMMMQMMAILAEYERNLIIERCQTGRKVAMAAGKKMGRPQEPHNSKADAAAAMYKDHMPIAQIMESLGVKSNRTIYKYLQQKGIKANRK